MPGADAAIRIADALEIDVVWLITGKEGRKLDGMVVVNEDDWLIVPRYPAAAIDDEGKGSPVEQVPLHRDWLSPAARAATNLWVTELPGSLDATAQDGDMILCHDADRLSLEGSYLYHFKGFLAVYRLEGPALDGLREPRATFTRPPIDSPNMKVIGRILGTIKLRPI